MTVTVAAERQLANIICSHQQASNMSASNPAGTKTQLQLLLKPTGKRLHLLHANRPKLTANSQTISVMHIKFSKIVETKPTQEKPAVRLTNGLAVALLNCNGDGVCAQIRPHRTHLSAFVVKLHWKRNKTLRVTACPTIFCNMKHLKSTSVSDCFSLHSQLPFPRPVATVISSASWELWFPVFSLASLRHCSLSHRYWWQGSLRHPFLFVPPFSTDCLCCKRSKSLNFLWTKFGIKFYM